MGESSTGLRPLFSPESIAVVGASPDSTYSSGLVRSLRNSFDGEIYLVNPGRDEVWGEPCHDSIVDVPEVVDVAVVSVPREHVVDAVGDAGRMGVPAAVVVTAGFSEADQKGIELEDRLVETANETGIRVCGPNTLGLANYHDRVLLEAHESETDRHEPGSIGLVSQSGALSFITFFERGVDEDLGFAYIVSTGNEAVLTTTDYVEYIAEDPRVDVICAYIEGVDDARRFMRVADTTTRSGTPILAVKIGRSESVEAATLSHTGSMVGNDDAWDAALAQTGVERVPDIPDLLGRASAHAAYEPPESNRVCVVSTSGGLTSLLADLADERGLELPDLTGETERTLLDIDDLLTFGQLHNPADIRGYGVSVLPEVADTLLADTGFDSYVFALGTSAVSEQADEIADSILAIAERATEPVFFLWTGRKEPHDRSATDPLPYERVRKEIPLYYDPARCMDALASLVRFGEWRETHADRPTRAELLVERETETDGRTLSERQVLAWEEAAGLLAEHGIHVVNTRLAVDADEAAAITTELGCPVVLKVASPDIPHRTDVDAVQTGISSEREARAAYSDVLSNARSHLPAASINGVLVQPQIDSGVEALIGVTRDELFGPVVTIAAGGTLAEVIDDSSVLIPPFSVADALDALEDTHLPTLLSGHRGGDVIDPEPLATLMCRIGELSIARPELVELDLNPVIVHGDGVSVADVLVRTR